MDAGEQAEQGGASGRDHAGPGAPGGPRGGVPVGGGRVPAHGRGPGDHPGRGRDRRRDHRSARRCRC